MYCPITSGSKGNCHLVASKEARLLLDAGTTAKNISAQLQALGVCAPDLDGILITHEHTDHIAAVRVLSRAAGVPLYCNEKTARQIVARYPDIPFTNIHVFETGVPFYIKDVWVEPFSIPHDAADPVGYALTAQNRKLTLATDVGYLTQRLLNHLQGASLVVLEANHDVDMLISGSYPEYLKQRIMGRSGHLSNECCGRALTQLLTGCLKQVVLAHLSDENNTPELAYNTVYACLAETVPDIKNHLPVDVAYQNIRGACYVLS